MQLIRYSSSIQSLLTRLTSQHPVPAEKAGGSGAVRIWRLYSCILRFSGFSYSFMEFGWPMRRHVLCAVSRASFKPTSRPNFGSISAFTPPLYISPSLSIFRARETFALALYTKCRIAKPINKCFNCKKLRHFSFSYLKLKRPDLHKIEEGLYKPLVKEDYAKSGNEEL